MRVRLINTSMLNMIDGDGFTQRNSSRSLSSASRAPAASAPLRTTKTLPPIVARTGKQKRWAS